MLVRRVAVAVTATLLLLIKLSVAGLILAIGMGSTLRDLVYLWRRPGLLLCSLLAMYVAVPLAAALGLCALIWPSASLAILLRLVAIYCLLDGVTGLIGAFRASERGAHLLQAILGLVVGVLLLFWPEGSVRTLLVIFGIWALLTAGLVGAWIPGLAPASATLRDLSGNGNHGTLVGSSISRVNYRGGRALFFNGDNNTDRYDLGSIDSANPCA